jgi:hypothetical protein
MPLLHPRSIVTILSAVVGIAGVTVALIWRDRMIGPPLGAALVGAAVIGVLLAQRLGASAERARVEPDDVEALSDDRLRELVRGTSLFLREMNYRYSIRIDPRTASRMRSFVTEVNGVRLGFVPVVVTDNTNDRQGFGYVAFVHDGVRWRGPGLPCPDDPAAAVKHAARCVSPLATEEETRYDETR